MWYSFVILQEFILSITIEKCSVNLRRKTKSSPPFHSFVACIEGERSEKKVDLGVLRWLCSPPKLSCFRPSIEAPPSLSCFHVCFRVLLLTLNRTVVGMKHASYVF